MIKSKYEYMLEMQLRMESIDYVREYRFDPVRKWRMDFVINPLTDEPIEIEIDGGGWLAHGGRHSKREDYEKRRAATLWGKVFYFTGDEVSDNTAIEFIVGLITE